MNKIRKLLQNIFKKDKKDQDLNDEFEPIQLNDQEAPDFEDATREIDAEFVEEEIDLANSKLKLKDRLDMSMTRVADKFRSLRQKEMKRESSSNKKTFKVKSFSKGVQWDTLPNRILSSDHHQKIHNYFQLGFIICIIFLGANIVGHIIAGKPTYKATNKGSTIVINEDRLLNKNQINQIKNSNIFRTTQVAKVEGPIKKEEDKKCDKEDDADKKSRLPIKLVNTVVLQDSVKSIASVQVRSSSKLESFRIGDKISSLAKIGRIDRLKVIVKNLDTGNCEIIESKARKAKRSSLAVLTPKASQTYKKKVKKVVGINNDGNNFTIKKSLLQDQLKDINALLTQARGVKINNPDGSLSFKIVEIQAGSVYDSLGVQNGDIIKEIGGEPIPNLNTVMSTFGNAANLKNMNLTIIRNGEEVKQDYKIVE